MKALLYISCILLLLQVQPVHAGETNQEIELLEEAGLYDGQPIAEPTHSHNNPHRPYYVLLIPESANDKVCAFSPDDGSYLFDFIFDDTSSTPQYDLQTPVNAVQGPGPEFNIFLSDQLTDAIYVFDPAYGQYLYTYADSSDGLNNIRGFDFRDGHLFVTSGDDYVAEFDGPHSLVRYFIQDGSDPFDILFLDDGTCLLSDIQGTTDNVRYYDSSGTLLQELFPVSFPEQIQQVPTYPQDTFYCASFSDDIITTFLIDGTITDTIPFSAGRGIYRLGNGNFLATNGTGVYEIDPATGAIIEQEYNHTARYIEDAVLTMGIDELEKSETNAYFTVAPNPFSQRVELTFQTKNTGIVNIAVYDVCGNRIKTIMDEQAKPGTHHRSWNGTDNKGTIVSNGVYFLRLATSKYTTTTKIILSR